MSNDDKVSAKVQTPTGMMVEITGTKNDVRDLLTTLTGVSSPSKATPSVRRHTRVSSANTENSALRELVNEGFFRGTEKTLSEVAGRLDEKGFSYKGRALGGLARALTIACRNPDLKLQRRKVTKEEKKAGEVWLFYQK